MALEAKVNIVVPVLSIKLAEIWANGVLPTSLRYYCLMMLWVFKLDNTRQLKMARNHFSIYPNLYYNNKFRPHLQNLPENLSIFNIPKTVKSL